MPHEHVNEVHSALQQAVDLIRQRIVQLKADLEDVKQLEKIKTLVEKLTEQFSLREFPAGTEINRLYDGLIKELDKQLSLAKQNTTTVESRYEAPLVFIGTDVSAESDELSANGIDGVTGNLLLKIDADAAARMAQGLGPESQEMQGIYNAKKDTPHLGTTTDFNQNKIEEARWAVVVRGQDDVRVISSLWPLIQHRMRQMGFSQIDFDFQSGDTTCGAWLSRHTDGGTKTLKSHWGKIPPVLLVRANERVGAWLSRHGTAQGPVNPTFGVPFYLLLASRPGSPDPTDDTCIPLNFQYELDMFWGVGRVAFTDENGRHRFDDYRTYAERVVQAETRADAAARLRKEIAFFGTRHEDDNSTQRSANELITPLFEWSKTGKVPCEQGFTQTICLGDDATRNSLEKLLSASIPPALLFTASHGIGLPLNDSTLLIHHQGALVTADFEFGKIKREHWMSGQDLDGMSNANLEGMIALLFACYGAGCPQYDEFIFDKAKPRRQIAPFPFIAQLPQRMLTKGALAVLGHVERAWTYSFGNESTKAQTQPFEDVIGRLLEGKPAGSATDQFNMIQGARSLTLTEELVLIDRGVTPDPLRLAQLWMARNDARNYALLGDPAVKLAI